MKKLSLKQVLGSFLSFSLLASSLAFPSLASAQTPVTPTLYCLGSCPTGPAEITANPTSGEANPTIQVGTVAAPTENPCLTETQGTVKVQTYGHEHRESGSISNSIKELLNLLKELLALIKQLLGGGSPSIPETPTTPAPTSGVPGGTNPDPCLTQQPAPTTGMQPTTGAVAPTTGTAPIVANGTPLGTNGQLHVCGTKLCNQFDKPIQLRGVSTHGLQWHDNCVNDSSFTALANDWKADVVRIAMYVDEGGYTTDPAGFRQKVDNAVEIATAKGMYVLIDWHILTPGNPNVHTEEAKEFFDYMSKKHGAKTNIFYEIANEPNGVSWDEVKNYANQVIPVIRANDPENIIIVGTPGFSSMNLVGGNSTDVVTGAPVDGTNLMYAFHFYAASHHDEWRNPIAAAADKLPIFATEWGTPTFTGDGGLDLGSAQQWLDMFAEKGISWASWNFSDDGQTGALLNGGSCPNGPWDNLKESGDFVKKNTLTPADNFPTN